MNKIGNEYFYGYNGNDQLGFEVGNQISFNLFTIQDFLFGWRYDYVDNY